MAFKASTPVASTETFELRLTPAEKQKLREDAELSGLTMAEFVRRRAFNRTIIPVTHYLLLDELRVMSRELRLAIEAGAVGSEMVQATLAGIKRIFSEFCTWEEQRRASRRTGAGR